MTQKWNLQDIRPVNSKRRSAPERHSAAPARPQYMKNDNDGEEGPEDEDGVENITIHDGNKSNKKKYIILSSVVLLLIFLVFGLSAILSKTTLTVYPEFREPVVNAEFTAYPDRREGSLSYEVITIEETAEVQVSASGQEEVESQAKGFIEIVKTTPGTERLIKNTRFRAPDGQVFRIQESVVVPGSLKDSSGANVPGTIRAEVFADAIGQEYNLPANTRFDVPGFKESNLDDLYSAIYAVNKDPMAGGFKGPKFLINDDELSTAKQQLQQDLRGKLLERIETEKPAGFTTFPGSAALSFESLPTVSYGDNLVTIREQAVLQLPLFKQDAFASYLAKQTVATYSREEVRIVDSSALTFKYTDSSVSSSNIANLTSLVFTLTGKPLIVSEFKAVQLQTDLAGKPKTAITTVLTGHPGIKSAKVSSKPFWKTAFPEDPTDIIIVEVIDEAE